MTAPHDAHRRFTPTPLGSVSPDNGLHDASIPEEASARQFQFPRQLRQLLAQLPIPAALCRLDDHTIGYLNPVARNHWPHHHKQPCWQVLAQRGAPCPGCPARELTSPSGHPSSGNDTPHCLSFTSRDREEGVCHFVQAISLPGHPPFLLLLPKGRRHPPTPPSPGVAADAEPAERKEGEMAREAREAEPDSHAQPHSPASATPMAPGRRVVDEFLATICHEIRTPLNIIMGSNELLAETPLNPEQQHFLHLGHRAGQTLMTLINDLLDLSKIEAGALQLDNMPFDPGRLASECSELFSLQARDSGKAALSIRCRISPRTPAWVKGDPNRIRQVLFNLLGNAVKFTHQGEVTLVVTPLPNDELHFQVRDTGIGLTAEQRTAIFQPYRQATAATQRRYGGTGLGLSISRHLVETMGGRIWVESVERLGSNFQFVLPLPAVAPPAQAAIPLKSAILEVQAARATQQAAGLAILLAEDSPDSRQLMNAFLKESPHRIDMVENGMEALERFKEHPYDLVLMDCQMPLMDGMAATRAIRQHEREAGRAPTPIMALTASALKEELEQMVQAGCDCYLTKPVGRKRLLASLDRFLPQPEHRGERLPVPAGGGALAPAMGNSHDLGRLLNQGRLSQLQLDQLADLLPQGLLTASASFTEGGGTPQWRISWCSHSLAAISGRPRHQLRNLPLEQLFSDGQSFSQADLGRLLSHHELRDTNRQLARDTQPPLPVQLSAALLQDGNGRIQGLVASITPPASGPQREEHALIHQVFEQGLREAEEQMTLATTICTQAMEGIAVADGQGRIQWVNPAFTAITGYSLEEASQTTLTTLLGDDDGPNQGMRIARQLRRDGIWRGEVWHRRRDGTLHPIQLVISNARVGCDQVTHQLAVFHDVAELRRSRAALTHHLSHDPLTELPNRTLFLERLHQGLGRAMRHRRQAALLVLNVDQFSKINASFSHHHGDLLLQALGQRLQEMVRSGDTLARLGADEFAFILEEMNGVQAPLRVVRALFERLQVPFVVREQEVFLNGSVGIALFPEDGQTPESLLKAATVAMKRAKKTSGNTFQYYAQALDQDASRRLGLENDLRKAVGRQEFQLHYQPKVSLEHGRIIGMEALIRWRHPQRGLVSPAEFIPMAEECGLINAMGEWALEEACRFNQSLCLAGHQPLRVAVNLSPRQFRHGDLPQRVQHTLERCGMDPKLLELEVTESMVMEEMDTVVATLARLSAMGVTISVDDFGTGYSSLSYLKRLPIHTLKVDRSFIGNLGQEGDDEAIVSAIISLAYTLSLTVVAEGVETVDQLNFLRNQGCHQIQGYYFSRPLAEQAFQRLLESGPKL